MFPLDRRIRFTLPFRQRITIRRNRAGRRQPSAQGGAANGINGFRGRQESRSAGLNGVKTENPGIRGTRASANTSGPDFTGALGPDEIADQRSAPNEENLFLLPDRFSRSELFRKDDPAV
jgi:hypothetical protein